MDGQAAMTKEELSQQTFAKYNFQKNNLSENGNLVEYRNRMEWTFSQHHIFI